MIAEEIPFEEIKNDVATNEVQDVEIVNVINVDLLRQNGYDDEMIDLTVNFIESIISQK